MIGPHRRDRTAGLATKTPRPQAQVGDDRLSPLASWRLGGQSESPSKLQTGSFLRVCISVASLCLVISLGWSAEEKPADTKPAPVVTAEEKPAEEKPAETKPAETKPADTKPADTKPEAAAGTATTDPKPAEALKPPTEAQLAEIRWEEFSADNTFVCPFAADFSNNEEFPERKTDWENFLAKFAVWAPGHVFDTNEKVRNLICAAALMDIGQGQFESELPLFVYQRLRREVPDAKLKEILGIMAFHPNEGSIIGTAPELDLEIGVGDDQIRERLQIFAVKMLGRLLGKLPWEPPAQP